MNKCNEQVLIVGLFCTFLRHKYKFLYEISLFIEPQAVYNNREAVVGLFEDPGLFGRKKGAAFNVLSFSELIGEM